jgi:PhnB protein
LTLMASDTPTGSGPSVGQATSDASGVSLSLSGEDAEELRGYWERLSARGSVKMPLQMQMWGDEFGMLVDEFGMTWMVNITGPENAGT